MGQIIIGVIVFIVVIAIQLAKAKQSKEMAVPHGSDEHFPFPEPDNQDEIDEWLGQSSVELKPQKLEPLDVAPRKMMGDYAAVTTFKPHEIISYAPKTEYEEFEFDVEKAVIYAEIMAPKYKEWE